MKKKALGFITMFVMVLGVCFVMPSDEVSAVELDGQTIANYVNAKVGNSYPNGMCTKFVEECYQALGGGRPYNCCASKSGNLYIKSNSSSNIPVGATVYFGNCGGGPCKTCGSSFYGHVGIYVGNGYFVHATGGSVQKSTISSWSNKYRGWGYNNNFTLKNTTPDPPTNTKVSVDKYYYYAGENVTFNLSSNGGTCYTVGIDSENGTRTRIDTKDTNSNSYTRSFSSPGKYSCYITSYNDAGLNDSSRIYFEVYNSKPKSATVSLDKYYYYSGENVTFKLSSELGFAYTIGIDDANGNRIDTKDTNANSYTRTFSSPGKYSCYITTYNVYGLADSKRIYFEIYNTKPQSATVSLTQSYYKVGENVTFNLSSVLGFSYTVGIDDANGNRIDTKDTNSSSYTRSFSSPGKYSCYITTYNVYGLADSERIYFEVYNTKPNNTKVSISKGKYMIGENVTFNLSSNLGNNYTVGIFDSDGNYVEAKDTWNKSYTRQFSTPGKYSCYITSYNGCGLDDSPRIYFEIEGKLSYTSKQSYNGHIYYLFDKNTQWTEARAYCKDLGGNLVIINSKEENDFVVSLAKKGNQKRYYTGLYSPTKDKKYVWVNGEQVTYSNWYNNEPNNGGDVEFYGEIIADNGLWNDVENNSSGRGFICEIDPSTCNHSWGLWTIEKPASCTSDGQQTRKCSICGKEETQQIAKTGHHYQETVIQPTYSEQGYTLHKCTGCGDSYKDKYVAKKRGYDPTKKPVASEVKKLQQLLTKTAKLAANEDLVDMFDANGDGKVNVIDALILKRRAIK